MGGSSSSGKTTFLNGRPFLFQDDLFFQIGVSFKLIDCLINNEDSYLLQVWDFKVISDFRCLYPSFCKGAKGALLCFDASNYNSFLELPYWIKTIRDNTYDIPILLIGTKIDKDCVVTNGEIQELIQKFQLNGIFFSSIEVQNREVIFKHLIKNMGDYSNIFDFNIILPENDKDFRNFMNFFISCPICGEKNHFNHLKRFYFSQKRECMELKKKLIELMDKSREFNKIYYNKINLGIPCCKCFKQHFE